MDTVYKALAIFAVLAPVALTVVGAVATLTTAVMPALRGFFAIAWRVWLWGSVGYVIGTVVVFTIGFALIVGGLMNTGPGPLDRLPAWNPLILTLLLPPASIVLGCVYGARLARRRLAPLAT